MCGIVGYLGSSSPKDIIMSGLKKLEYRGYDSSGLAVFQNGETKLVRALGKLSALEEKIKTENWTGHIGIGHTRWATHGAPSEVNAHPHKVKGVTIVHNGIIENYAEIKASLIKKGALILSETDTELVAHLIAEEVEQGKALRLAVQNVLPKLKGAFSIVVLSEKTPDELVAFKDGPPLVVGLGKNENFVASDVQALIKYTQDFIYLNDREIVSLTKDNVSIFDHYGNELKKKSVTLNWSPELTEKQGFAHYMLKEIYEQPRGVAAAIEPHLEGQKVRLDRIGFYQTNYFQNRDLIDLNQDWKQTQNILSGIERVFIIACGTSYYAGQIAKYYLEKLSQLPVEIDIASEFRYREPIIPQNTLVITISQSGETADTLAAIRLAKDKGALTLSVCNVRNSSIDREAHGHLYMGVGPEIGVASTKAFTATVALLNIFSLGLGQIRGVLSSQQISEQVAHLRALPSKMEVALAYDKYFLAAADSLKNFKGFLFMGRGTSYPIAMEGALKLKELAYLHAEGYAAGEMKHGPIALIDSKMAIVTVAPRDSYFEKTLSNIEEVKARGGYIISIGSSDDQSLKNVSQVFLPVPNADWATNPILYVIPLQLMAYHVSSALGYDVDQPRNLAKSVTVE